MNEKRNWIVFVEDGHTRLMSPLGEIVTNEIDGFLSDSVGEPQLYIATFLVDLVPDLKAAQELSNKTRMKKSLGILSTLGLKK